MKFRYIDPGDIVSVIVVLVVLTIGLFCFSTVTQSINKTENISPILNITELGESYIGNFPFVIIVLVFILMFLFLYKARSGRYSADYELPKETKDEKDEEKEPEPSDEKQPDKIELSRFKSDENKKKYNWSGK